MIVSTKRTQEIEAGLAAILISKRKFQSLLHKNKQTNKTESYGKREVSLMLAPFFFIKFMNNQKIFYELRYLPCFTPGNNALEFKQSKKKKD